MTQHSEQERLVNTLVAAALDDLEAGRLDLPTALRMVAEAAWNGALAAVELARQ